MTNVALVFLLFLLPVVFLAFFSVNLVRKLVNDYQEKTNSTHKKAIKEQIEGFISKPDNEFWETLQGFCGNALHKDLNYRTLVDAYLLDALELPGITHRDRLIAIAREMRFPSECLAQIRSGNPEISALGSRRAGLYNVKEAAGEMMNALKHLSSENQFAILMALARIGNADAMQLAFEWIKNSVMLNERAVIEILSSFPNGEEKTALFRKMIRNDTHYIAGLFLKATDGEIARVLVDEIRAVLHNGNKEVRAAAVRGLASLGKDAPAEDLLRALTDSDWEVRALAAKALGPIEIPRAGLALFKALSDQQWWVRQNAAKAMINHPGYETLFLLAAEIGDEYTRDSILNVLEDGGSPLLLRYIKIMAA